MLGHQLLADSIGTSTNSIMWTVLEYTRESDTVYINPEQLTNYGRFINGVSSQDERMANLTVIKSPNRNDEYLISFLAIRNIYFKEQFFYAYGDGYSTHDFLSVKHLTEEIEWDVV